MRFHVNSNRVRDLQVKAISNPNLDITQQNQIIATFTPTVNTRVTKILVYYDDTISALEDLEVNFKLKDSNSFYFLENAPLHTIGNRKSGSNNHFMKIAFEACQEKEEILLTSNIELQISATNRFVIPERKIFLLIDSYKDIS